MPARRTQQEPCGERRDSSLRCHVIRPGGRKEDVTQVCRAWIATAGTDNPQLGGKHPLIFWTRLTATERARPSPSKNMIGTNRPAANPSEARARAAGPFPLSLVTLWRPLHFWDAAFQEPGCSLQDSREQR